MVSKRAELGQTPKVGTLSLSAFNFPKKHCYRVSLRNVRALPMLAGRLMELAGIM